VILQDVPWLPALNGRDILHGQNTKERRMNGFVCFHGVPSAWGNHS
jgi:hypothetical protein